VNVISAQPTKLTVVGLGEILWDMLPAGRQLGGGPTNFSYISHLLGNRAIVASRIGADPAGDDIRAALLRLGLASSHLQSDAHHPTGKVEVLVDAAGQPQFRVHENVAWDFLEWTPAWRSLASSADVVCFGTLAQRSPASRSTIAHFVRATPARALRVFDVNLRAPFYTTEIIADSLTMANVLKLNHEELPLVAGLLSLPFDDDETCARRLLKHYGLRLVCVTRGAHGSLLVDASSTSEHPGFPVRVVDTVGAGDAFTASLAHHLGRGAPLPAINAAANRLAAWVSSRPGGTPALEGRALQESLKAVGNLEY
jgi:fructokinase